jgi:hypothetical protein
MGPRHVAQELDIEQITVSAETVQLTKLFYSRS